jgi:hypothetical protein
VGTPSNSGGGKRIRPESHSDPPPEFDGATPRRANAHCFLLVRPGSRQGNRWRRGATRRMSWAQDGCFCRTAWRRVGTHSFHSLPPVTPRKHVERKSEARSRRSSAQPIRVDGRPTPSLGPLDGVAEGFISPWSSVDKPRAVVAGRSPERPQKEGDRAREAEGEGIELLRVPPFTCKPPRSIVRQLFPLCDVYPSARGQGNSLFETGRTG